MEARRPNELPLSGLRELHLFCGAGGGILGGMLLGHTCVCAVEIEPYCRKILLQRQRDGILPVFPIWDDIRNFDAKPWRGRVDVVCGGFPCQDISVAGEGAGLDGVKSGLWREQLRIIGEVGPRYVLVENSPALTVRGGGARITAELAAMGYVGSSGVLGAEDAIWDYGNPCADHERRRIWFCGKDSNADSLRKLQPEGRKQDERGRICDPLPPIPDAHGEHGEGMRIPIGVSTQQPNHGRNTWWHTEPGVCRVADGVSSRVDFS